LVVGGLELVHGQLQSVDVLVTPLFAQMADDIEHAKFFQKPAGCGFKSQ
jgi:hypothetical protein